MSETYPNERDCEHGRQRGKCSDCDVARLECELAEKDARIRELEEALSRMLELHDATMAGETKSSAWIVETMRTARLAEKARKE